MLTFYGEGELLLQYRDICVPAWDSLAAMQLKGVLVQSEPSPGTQIDVLLPLLPAVSSCHHLMAQVQMPDDCCNKVEDRVPLPWGTRASD